MKTAGIIGGLGPETTAEFYLEIIFSSYKKNKTQRPPLLIWNVPLNYEIEEELLISSEGENSYIPYLTDAAKRLEKGGADFLVMPCNTLHIFIEEIRNSVSIPVLNIVEETTKFLKNEGLSKVGLLATSSSLNHKLYQKSFETEGIEQIIPDESDQTKIGEMINNIVLHRHDEQDRKNLITVIEKLGNKGASDIILACTDLQLLIPKHPKLKIYDTMKILADSVVNKILE